MLRYLENLKKLKKNFRIIFGNNYWRNCKHLYEKIREEFRKIFKMWKTLEEILEKFGEIF